MKKKLWIDIWWLLVFAFLGACLLIALMAALSYVCQGAIFLHLVQWAQTIFMIFLPAVLWCKFYKKESLRKVLYLHFPGCKTLLLVTMFMIVMMPAMDGLSTICQQIPLPETIEQWAKSSLDSQEQAVSILLSVDGIGGWFELIMLMCFATALAEESMFRGALCHLGHSTLRTAILTGLIFALCHGDLYGLIPRWLLGTLFAELMFWTGSIWPNILAHALNNLCAIIQMKLAIQNGIDTSSAPNLVDYLGWWSVPMSVIVSILILWVIYTNRKRNE